MKAVLKKLFLCGPLLLGSLLCQAHGFSRNTVVHSNDGKQDLAFMSYSYLEGNNLYVQSRNMDTAAYVENYVRVVAESQTNCYFDIGFGQDYSTHIRCTPDQEFYNPFIERWIPAFQLKVGDILLAKDNEFATVSSVQFIQSKLTVYAIEVDNNHNYFVGSRAVLTHNLAFPIVATFSLSASFGAGGAAGGTAGSFFGPVTFAGGFIIGGLIGVGIYALSGRDKNTYGAFYNTGDIEQYLRKAEEAAKDKGKAGANSGNSGSSSSDGDKGKNYGGKKPETEQGKPEKPERAPGKPTGDDGYEPPKNSDGEKKRHPKTGQYGWEDQNGNIWVPDRSGHRGPHWDKIDRKGRHTNVLPGGKEV